MPDFPEKLNSAEDKAAAQLEKDFLESVNITVRETDWEKLERNLQAHANGDEVIDGIAWEDYDPKEVLKNLFGVALDLHGEYIGEVTGGAKFDIVDPRALEWIDKYGASEVKYISESQREAIKKIVLDGYENGIPPAEQAREIRNHIGLDPHRSEVLQRYGENLLAKGIPEDRVWQLMEKRGKALLNARALGIAVNEASEAGGRATYESTKSAAERGVLDPYIYEGYRIITPDERLCKTCEAVAGEGRKLPDGVYPSSGDTIAKKHNLCRCVEGLREIAMKKQSNKTIQKTQIKGFSDIIFDTQALKRKDGIIYCQTVPIIEGVYEQWGIRVYRSYAEFSKYSHWLAGIPVVTNHEEVTPEARRIGQLFDPINKPEGLKTASTTRFYEIDLTQRESEQILSGKPIEGSLRWMCYIIEEKGEWTNPTTGERVPYDFKEVGPYVFIEYSMVRAGVIGTKDGAGFNMQCKNCQKDHIHHAPGGAEMEPEQIKEMIEEAQKPLNEKIAALEQKNTELEGKLVEMKQNTEADKNAKAFEAFKAKLKPGYEDKAQEFFTASQKDASWMLNNMDKFVQTVPKQFLRGSPLEGGAAQTFDLAKEQDKLWGRAI